ncbi:hypothetical protein FACS189431_3280 [Alphaproteobacteria bacterium]|nr:hypothetical protein FACS189431_3280 [Alphaproteobacteria bacterium]
MEYHKTSGITVGTYPEVEALIKSNPSIPPFDLAKLLPKLQKSTARIEVKFSEMVQDELMRGPINGSFLMGPTIVPQYLRLGDLQGMLITTFFYITYEFANNIPSEHNLDHIFFHQNADPNVFNIGKGVAIIRREFYRYNGRFEIYSGEFCLTFLKHKLD